MHTQQFKKVSGLMTPSIPKTSLQGCISELSYDAQQPHLLDLLLMPLLKQLSQQSRWQLWLTPSHKLRRDWLLQSGVPLEKSMQVTRHGDIKDHYTMLRALRSGNFSVVLAWLDQELTDSQQLELEQAAQDGQCLGFIMRPGGEIEASHRQENHLKIHSNRLH